MSSQKLFEEIKDFITQVRNKYRFELQMYHSLQSDLGIYGLDAVDFILDFGKKFKVDVSGFDTVKYFKPEGHGGPNKNYPNITIGDLHKSVEQGYLI